MNSSNLSMPALSELGQISGVEPAGRVTHPAFVDENGGCRIDPSEVPLEVRLTHDPHLKPGDEYIQAEKIRLYVVNDPLSPEDALLLLSGNNARDDSIEIGDVPLLAATSLPENSHVKKATMFKAEFGRDMLITGRFLHKRYPSVMDRTLVRMAQLQAHSDADAMFDDSAVGKIPHEYRVEGDENRKVLEERNNWKFPYYGSIDATPLFIQAVAEHVEFMGDLGHDFLARTFIGKDGNEHTMRESAYLATQFLLNELNSNDEGLLEFKRKNPMGLENQAWQDSWDAYHHANGTIANHDAGIASIEVQAYAYDALLAAAKLFPDAAEGLKEQSEKLRRQVLDRFWVEDEKGGFFALGTDRDEEGNLRVMKVRKSNMGHLLDSAILEGDDPEVVYKRNALIKELFSPRMMAENGLIRTLASDELRFRPTAYHNGNCWGHDNNIIARGLARHGINRPARKLSRAIVAIHEETGVYPENVRGNGDKRPVVNDHSVKIASAMDDGIENQVEQVPQEIQAWMVGAYIESEERLDTIPFKASDLVKRMLEIEILSQVELEDRIN